MKEISKGRFLKTLQCPLTGWELRRDLIPSIAEDDYFSQYIADQGHIIGDLATRWFDVLLLRNKKPVGVNIDDELRKRGVTREDRDQWLQAAIELTAEALQNPNVWAIYEATVKVGNYVTRADILGRSGQAWNMIEVKSITEKRDEEYVLDMAYTTAVLRTAGVPVKKVGLMRIDRTFVLADVQQLKSLDSLLDLLSVVWEWQPMVEQAISSFAVIQPPFNMHTWDYVDQITASSQPPFPQFVPSCTHDGKKCPSCRKVLNQLYDCNLILDLPNIGNMVNRFNELMEHKIYCIENVPDGFFSNKSGHEKSAAIVVEATKQQKVYANTPSLQNELSDARIAWPILYLDFEFIGTAIPLFEGAQAYEQVPIQYSLHRADKGDEIAEGVFAPDLDTVEHREFICDPQQDQRLAMAQHLANSIEELTEHDAPDSTIFAYYSSVEERCVEYLASVATEAKDFITAERLLLAHDRIRDLYSVVKGTSLSGDARSPNVYQPDFGGRFGLKHVIKAFFPDLYSNLDIASGDAATAAFARLVYAYRFPFTPWKVSDFDETKIIKALKTYCQLDTYSCILLHERLVNLIRLCQDCLGPEDIIYRAKDSYICPDCKTMRSTKDRGHTMFRCRPVA